jgi:hypothetical protein
MASNSTCVAAWVRMALCTLAGASIATDACADGRVSPAPLDPLYRTECGECHVPYAPALMGAAQWRTTMADLSRHFGTDASLDAKSTASIAAYLERNARPYRREPVPLPEKRAKPATPSAPARITTSSWFVREHDEVPAAVWKRKAIGSPSNCGACHAHAADGAFSEDDVRIPR